MVGAGGVLSIHPEGGLGAWGDGVIFFFMDGAATGIYSGTFVGSLRSV